MKCHVCQTETGICKDNEIGKTMDCPTHIIDPICIVMEVKSPGVHFYQRPACTSFFDAKRFAENKGITIGQSKNECTTTLKTELEEKVTICLCDYNNCNLDIQSETDNQNPKLIHNGPKSIEPAQPVVGNRGISMNPNLTKEIILFNICIKILCTALK